MNARKIWVSTLTIVFLFFTVLSEQITQQRWSFAAESTGSGCCVLFKPFQAKSGADRGTISRKWSETLGLPSQGSGDDAVEHPLVKALTDYEHKPNVQTGLVALEQAFVNLAGDNKKETLRHRAFGITADKPQGDPERVKLFLTLDLLKYELPLQAVLRINSEASDASRKIAFSYRVGSSGKRFVELLEWRARGGNLDELSIELTQLLTKLINSDDDNTNTALRQALVDDPVLNEQLNGNRATDLISEISASLGHRINPKTLKTEFLSPTKAYSVIRVRAPGPVAGFEGYMGAYVAADPEKYRGLNAEEQLHEWGKKAGIAIDMRQLTDNPTAQSVLDATKPYVETPDLMAMNGRYSFSTKGVRDLFGWAANNHRQIHVVHDGTLQDYAKYFLRDADWWARIAFEADANGRKKPQGRKLDLESTTEMKRLYGIDFNQGEFRQALELAKIVREPPDSQTLKNAIAQFGENDGGKKAIAMFRRLEMQLVEAAHQRNIDKIAAGIERGLKLNAGDQGIVPEDLTLDKLIYDATVDEGKQENADRDRPNHDLRASMEVLATAYTNFSEQAVERLGEQLAKKITEIQNKANASDTEVHAREVTKFLRLAWERVRQSATDTRRQAAGFVSLKNSFEEIKSVLDDHTSQVLKRQDLDAYVDQIIEGEVTQKRLVWDAETNRLRWAEQQWPPDFVASDVTDLKAMGNLFFWDKDTQIQNLYLYLHGKDGAGENFAHRALEAIRSFKGVVAPSGRSSRIRIPDGEGGWRYSDIRVGSVSDRLASGTNLAVVSFKMALKDGPGMVQGGWGIWGDISDGAELASAMIKLFPPTSQAGRTPDEVAVTQAIALSKAIGLADYGKHLSDRFVIPDGVGAFTGTLATAASLTADPVVSEENVKQLMMALASDVILLHRPDLAAAFVAYEIGTWTYTSAVKAAANHAMVQLLLTNGIWDTETADGIPVLKGIRINEGRVILDDPVGRSKACAPRPANIERPPSVGLMLLAKSPGVANGLAGGIQIQGEAIFAGAVNSVNPRRMLLNLYYSGDHDKKNPGISVTLDAIKSLGLTGALGTPPSNTDLKKWSDNWFKDQKIILPAREDAVYAPKRQQIVVRWDAPFLDTNRNDLLNTGTGSYWGGLGTSAVKATEGAKEGLLENFGYQAMHYRVERQNVLECAILDAVIKNAQKQKRDEVLKEAGLSNIEEEMARLEQRIIDLDKKVWPNISDASGPFEGKKYNPKKDRPLLASYRSYTVHLRLFLKQAIDYASSGNIEDNPLYQRYYLDQEVNANTPTVPELQDKLREKARKLLIKLDKIVTTYEGYYLTDPGGLLSSPGVLNSAKDARKYVLGLAGHGKGFDILRFDLGLRPVINMEDRVKPKAFLDPSTDFAPLGDDPLAGQLAEAYSDAKSDPRGAQDKERAKKWADTYKEQYQQALETASLNLEELIDKAKPLSLKFPQKAEELASADHMVTGHPLWAHILRLGFQVQKLDHVSTFLESADEKRLKALLAKMSIDDPKFDNSQKIDLSDFSKNSIASNRQQMKARQSHLLKLLGGVANLEVKTDSNIPKAISEQLTFKVSMKSIERPGSPNVEQFKKMIGYFRWEMIPIDKWEETLWVAQGGAMRDQPLASLDGTTCNYQPLSSPGAGSEAEQYSLTKKYKYKAGSELPEFKVRLVRSGSYWIRVTAFTRDHIPLSVSETYMQKVNPIEVHGEVSFNGTPEEGNPDISVLIGAAGPSSFNRFVPVAGEGEFVRRICAIPVSETNHVEIVEEGGLSTFPASPIQAYAGVRKINPTTRFYDYNPRSQVKIAQLHPRTPDAPPRLEILQPMVIFFGDTVEVVVNLRDAANKPVDLQGIEIVLDAGGELFTGLSPFNVPSKEGQLIKAIVEFDIAGRRQMRKSRTVTYDSKQHQDSLSIDVRLPFFEPGNLRVVGNFKAIAEDDAPNPVIAGEAVSATPVKQNVDIGDGGNFDFTNEQRHGIKDAIAFAGIMYDRDDWMYKPASTAPDFKTGASEQTFKNVPAERHELWISPIRFKAVDYAARDLPTDRIKLRMPGSDILVSPDPGTGEFNIGASFKKYHEVINVRIEFIADDGQLVFGEYPLRLEDLGGPHKAKPPSETLEVPVPVYLPGSLLVAGQFELDAPTNKAPNLVKATVIQGFVGKSERWETGVGQPFRFDISETVRAGDKIVVTGEAGDNAEKYVGDATALAPSKPKRGIQFAQVGTILLSKGDLDPVCKIARERIAQAYQQSDKGAFDQALRLLASARDLIRNRESCKPLVPELIAAIDRVILVSGLATATDTAIAICDLERLLTINQRITNLKPPNTFLTGKQPSITRVVTTLTEVSEIQKNSDMNDAAKLLAAREKLKEIVDLTNCTGTGTLTPTGPGDPQLGNVPPVALFVASVKGDGFLPLFSMDAKRSTLDEQTGLVFETQSGETIGVRVEGSKQVWLTVKAGESQDEVKDRLKKELITGFCSRSWGDLGPGSSQGVSARQPEIWHHGPEITTIAGPYEEKAEFGNELASNWSAEKSPGKDGPWQFMDELFKKARKAKDCGGDCCKVAECIEGVACGLVAND
ncbi:MAG: hypothetical protein AAF478_04760 [Pseudomonadota bacterium]